MTQAEELRAIVEAAALQQIRETDAVRKRRFRDKRRQAGWQDQLIWLSPEGQAALAALRQPGETLDACVNRVLVTLHNLRACGTSPVPSPIPQETSPVPSPPCPEPREPQRPTQSRTSPVPSPPPAIAPDDATLFAALQEAEAEDPRPTYAAIAAQLGLPAGTVSRKAAAWIKAGALQPRPLGGARPRRRPEASP
jgi:hypothetical protein